METSPTETKLPLLKKKAVPSLDEQHMHEIISSIYLGDLESSQDVNLLNGAGISYMVDLANTVEFDQSQRGKKHFEIVQEDESCDWIESCPCIISKLFINVDDTEDGDIGEHFDIINEYISRSLKGGGKILVHCVRGKSRSAAAVVQYLMQNKEYTLRAAMRTVYQGRPGVAINPGFKNQLQKLEARLRPGEPPSVILKVASKKPTLSRDISASSSTTRSVSSNSSVGSTNLDNNDTAPPLKSPLTSVRKLPPYSPHSPDVVGGGILSSQDNTERNPLSAEEEEIVPSYCTLTMADAISDIKAAVKKHGLNERGTKKQLLSRLVGKLGANPNDKATAKASKPNKGEEVMIDLKTAPEYPDSSMELNKSTPTVVSCVGVAFEQNTSFAGLEVVSGDVHRKVENETNERAHPDNDDHQREIHRHEHKMPPITLSPNCSQNPQQIEGNNHHQHDKMPPISFSPNSKNKEEDTKDGSLGLVPITLASAEGTDVPRQVKKPVLMEEIEQVDISDGCDDQGTE